MKTGLLADNIYNRVKIEVNFQGRGCLDMDFIYTWRK